MIRVETKIEIDSRAATATKASKAQALPKFSVSICSYKKQLVKKIWGRILGLVWLKFAVAAVDCFGFLNHKATYMR
jgi:hypothetical protein